jgi:hypothetical protein
LLNGRIATFWIRLEMCQLIFQHQLKNQFLVTFEFAIKEIGEVGLRSSCKDNHYPWSTIEGQRTT